MPFRSPARAQLWFERRRHLLSFPLVVGGMAILNLGLLLGAGVQPEKQANWFMPGLNFVFAPLIWAPFFGCFLGRAGSTAGNPYRLSSFIATRPIPVTALVIAKLKVAVLATLAAWSVALAAASVWLVESGHQETLWKLLTLLVREYPWWRVGAILLLTAVGPFVLTWRLLVDNLWIGLTGRQWIVRASLLACSVGLTAAAILSALVVGNPEFGTRVWAVLPWWAGGAVLVKLLAFTGVARALLQRGIVRAPTVAKLLALWTLIAAILFGLGWAVAPAKSVPLSLLAFAVLLSIPAVRLAAAPLALAWSRHR
jgi:hypothetical protein